MNVKQSDNSLDFWLGLFRIIGGGCSGPVV